MKDASWLAALRHERISQSSRNPGLAALMSFFFMGLGQIYAGHVDRGIVFLVIQLGSMTCGYSLYAKGMIYEMLNGFVGTGILVGMVYVLCVGYILLWIYNIKDAYYLSLFAGFRDWFEIERTVVPLLTNYKMQLLPQFTDQEGAAGRESGPSPHLASAGHSRASGSGSLHHSALADDLEEEDFIETVPIRSEPPDAAKRKGGPKFGPRKKDIPVTGAPALGDWSFNFKFYGLFAGILVLVGIIIINHAGTPQAPDTYSSSDYVSLNRDFSFVGSHSFVASFTSGTLEALQARSQATGTTPSPAAGTSIATSGIPPLNPDQLMADGRELIRAGRYASGAELLELALVKRDAPPPVWKDLSAAYREIGRGDLLEETLKRYLQAYPLDVDDRIALGKLQYDRREFVEASRSFSRALETVPNHSRANYLMGSIFRELGMPEDAIPCLNKALSSDPLNPEFHRELGAAYLDAREFKPARRHLEKVLSINPQDEAARGLMTQLDATVPADAILVETPKSAVTIDADRIPPFLTSVMVPTTPLPTVPTPEPRSNTTPPSPGTTAPPASERSDGSADGTPVVRLDKKPAETVNTGPKLLYMSPDHGSVAESPAAPFIPNHSLSASGNSGAIPGIIVMPTITPTASPGTGSNTSADAAGAAGATKPDVPAVTMASASPASTPSAATPPTPPPNQDPSLKRSKPIETAAATATATAPKAHTAPPSADDALANAEAVNDGEPPRTTTASEAAKHGASPLLASPTVPAPVTSAAPATPEDLLAQGRNKYFAGKWEEALPFFLKSLKQREDPTAYDYSSHTLEKIGLLPDAYDASYRAYQMGKRDPVFLARLGSLAERTRHYDEGVLFLRAALEKLGHRVDLRFKLAACLRETGQTGQAVTELEAISRLATGTYAIQRRLNTELTMLKGDEPSPDTTSTATPPVPAAKKNRRSAKK
jgi:tetratricopeptide (TPR) repeat protein/TM2 domain-containing membrane protein YozV